MRPLLAFLRLVQIVALALAIGLGCTPSPPASAVAKPAPTSVVEAETLKKGGVSWTNEEVRVYYNEIVGTIAAANDRWKQEGLPVEERARRASRIRHDARLTCRAMMASRDEVEDLRRRDQDKYGNPDGPTFEHLVESARKKGVTGDAIYEGIIASAQRTDAAVNAAFGIKRGP